MNTKKVKVPGLTAWALPRAEASEGTVMQEQIWMGQKPVHLKKQKMMLWCILRGNQLGGTQGPAWAKDHPKYVILDSKEHR